MLVDVIKAIIFGIIEGRCEGLPVSSTGHIILLGDLLSFEAVSGKGAEFAAAYSEMFDFVIQLGAIMAVVFLYFGRLNFLSRAKSRGEKREIFSLLGRLVVASIPAGVIFVVADKLFKAIFGRDINEIFYNSVSVASMLVLYGLLFLFAEYFSVKGEKEREIGVKEAFFIGCFQALSIIPGTSRSGATILGARLLGVSREKAAEFSFLLAVPAIAGASLLGSVDFVSFVSENQVSVPFALIMLLLVASFVAFLVSMATIKALVAFVKKRSFASFGIYRIALGVTVLLLGFGR